MQRLAALSSCLLAFVAIFPLSLISQDQMKDMKMPQKGCEFNLVGTWQSSTNGQVSATRRRFASDGIMWELSRHGSGQSTAWEPTGKARYRVDNANMPKAVVVTPVDSVGHSLTATTLNIKTYDNGLLVTASDEDPGAALTRWTRIDPYRYFVVLAAGKGDTGFGAPGFAMLIKTDGIHTKTNAFGVYPVVNPLERHPIIGVIPAKIRKEFAKEPVGDTGSMLRLEVTAGPYNRALEVMQTWERRADENTLLYTVPYLNNAVYLNQLTSSLDETGVLTWEGGTPCTETIKLQKLTWRMNDEIMHKHNLTQTPYYLFKALRQLNDSLHLDDTRFHEALSGGKSSPVVISSR